MSTPRKTTARQTPAARRAGLVVYGDLVGGIAEVLEAARRTSARAVNAVMTATYWEIGRRIVEHEQGGRERAEYGDVLIERLAKDLTARFGRGFSVRNVWQMKAFYLAWPIPQTVSAESSPRTIPQTSPAEFLLVPISARFPLPWSAYVRLLAVKN
jgi:hypothetical protein